MKALLVYLKVHFAVSLLFCLMGNIQGVFVGIPLYGVLQAWILALAVKNEIWKSCTYVHRSDVLIASLFMVVFSAAIVLNILYMFCKDCFPALEMLNSCTHVLYFGLWGTVIYILATLPLMMMIPARKLKV